MAPIFRREVICPTAFNTSSIDRSSTAVNTQTNSIRSKDGEALLYIVVTLLFYSLGIIIGIVSYLKQEKEEIEENKMFDEFINNKGKSLEHTAKDKQILVQKAIDRLKEIETASYVHRSRFNSTDILGACQSSYSTPQHNKYNQLHMERDYTGDTGVHGSDYDMSDADEDPFPNRRLSQVVAKILESETTIEHMDDDQDQQTGTSDSKRSETNIESMQRSDSSEIGTDFIDYNEEPKNKTLFRGLGKEGCEITITEDNTKTNTPDVSPYDAKAIDPVFENSKRRQSLLEKFANNDLESIEEECESPTYKWSVTSV